MRIKPISAQVAAPVAPTVIAPLGISTGFARGLGQIGQALGEVGQTIQEITKRKKAFDDSVSLIDLTGQAKVSLAGHADLVQMTDYDKIPDERKNGLDRIRKEMADKASAINPEVSANWKKVWSTLSAGSQIETGRIETEKFRQNTIAGVVNYTHIMENEAVKATIEGDTEKVALIYDAVNSAIDNVKMNFQVSGHQAEVWKEGFKDRIEAQVNAAEKEAVKQQEKGLITTAYIGISQEAQDPLTGKTDYTKAYKLLRQPETLRAYGITAEQKDKLTSILRNDQARDKEETDAIKESQRGEILRGVIAGTMTNDIIDDTILSEKEKFSIKEKIEARNKAITSGGKDPYKEYDPGKRAEISRLIRTDPDEIKDRGGVEYIYEHVGLGKSGGITIEQAESFAGDYSSRNEPKGKGPTQQQTYKEAAGSLDLFRKNWQFIEAEPGDEIDDEQAAKNEYVYGSLVEELENRVNAGEKPYDVLEDIMKPYAQAEAEWTFASFLGFSAEEEDQRYQEMVGGDGKRAQAIKLLKENKKLVNEETIKSVMDQL